jgi:tRNA threonylcarbamoyladenosine biosynthesis protein TsaE
MAWRSSIKTLTTETETRKLAEVFAQRLTPGDVVLLSGHIGAGKSAFCRAFIRHRVGLDIDVPSPTFTLVQTYETDDTEIWHCDLYRLSEPDELIELGLDEAFETAICLIEWPDRLADLIPQNALNLMLCSGERGHDIQAQGSLDWQNRIGDLFDPPQ